jgi:hypothetical protein
MNTARGFSLSVIFMVIAGLIIIVVAGYFLLHKNPVTSVQEIGTVAAEALSKVSEPDPPKYMYCPTLDRELTQGDVDEKLENVPEIATGQVTALQTFLKLYFDISDPSFVDGIYGPNTASYVRKFQKETGLPETAVVDPATKARIKKVCADPLTSTKTVQKYEFNSAETIVLHSGEAYAESGDPDMGHYRIEYVSSSPARVRVTGRHAGGAVADVLTLETSKSKISNHWPGGLQITLNKVNSDGSLELTVARISTD